MTLLMPSAAIRLGRWPAEQHVPCPVVNVNAFSLQEKCLQITCMFMPVMLEKVLLSYLLSVVTTEEHCLSIKNLPEQRWSWPGSVYSQVL